MLNLCKYKDILGKPKQGVHSFRIFDIAKPWPIKQLEKLPGPWGVIIDDLLAGGLASLIIYLIIKLTNF